MYINEVNNEKIDSESNSPVITILTVTLNAAIHLPGLIESVRNQDLTGVEWVVIDGNSTDGTINQINDARDVITQAISESDSGYYDALNKAVQRVRSSFYIVMGADDRFAAGALMALKSAVQAAGDLQDLVLFPIRRSGRVIKPHVPTKSRLILGWSFVIASHSVGVLIRTRLHERFGKYSLRYPLLADGYFLTKVLVSDVPVTIRNEVVGEFADGGMTSVDDARIAAETWLIQVHLGRNIMVQTLLFIVRVARYLFKKVRSV